MTNPCKRWIFTLNNYTDADQLSLRNAYPTTFAYLIYGREVGESGTPHLQGFFVLSTKLRLRQVKLLGGLGRAHLEVARGTPVEAATYCKKDQDFEEFGDLPSNQGKRTDFETLKEWIKEQDISPSHRDLAENFPSLWGRYRRACLDFVSLFGAKPILCDGPLRSWQQELDEMIKLDADDRKIIFVIDPDGKKGKSWLTRYWFSSRDDMQRLSIGKRDDLAYAIDVSKKIFVFDIPRGQLEYLQYNVLETLKDQMLFSPKYDSCTKIIAHMVHVIVFTNEEPDMTAMTEDRYRLMRITNL